MRTASRVALVYFNAGGGHRASALALQQALAEAQPQWQVELLNLTELLDPDGRWRRLAFSPEDYYNARLAHGLTLGLKSELKVLQALIRLLHPTLLKALLPHWRQAAPDLVVSLIPNFNRVLFQSLRLACPATPYVTLLTDFADLPPHFWIEAGQQQDFICGTARAVQQALALGHAAARVHATSGMLIRPDFYRLPPLADRAAALRDLGLDPQRPTGVVMFGGHGSRSMLEIAQQLADQQLILLCGHNDKLLRRLQAQPASAPRLLLGFTPEVARLLQLGDYFIGKPGPGSLSEALHLGLPVVVTRNAWTMPQERYNAQWVREQGVGMVLPSFRRIAPAVRELLAELPAYQQRVRQLRNQAVFEVPRILHEILARSQAAQRRSA